MNHLKPSPRHHGLHKSFRSKSARAASPAHRASSTNRSGAVANSLALQLPAPHDVEGEAVVEDDPVHLMLKEKWSQSESRIAALFGADGIATREEPDQMPILDNGALPLLDPITLHVSKPDAPPPAKKAARTIDEDDYGDDDDEEEEEESQILDQSPLQSKAKPLLSNGFAPPMQRSHSLSLKPTTTRTSTSSSTDQGKTSEDVRRKLEEDKRAAEEKAVHSFHSMFYTLESDRDAMLEQQKLDDLDRQVEDEMGDGPNVAVADGQTNGPAQGTLSTADLGASSLTLKNLIARIDAKRSLVNANDTQLRTLIGEVRKGRSKWASEEKVGQEELYEAAEKVLMELKAMTEYSAPFLQRVAKREAPDYYNVIKQAMDIGTMIKKLKGLGYKSKKEFVADLSLIWSNCLQYNVDPNHPLRKKALYMRKETDKLVPLIPDITIKDRAEAEADERRQHDMDIDVDGEDSSEDDQPIMASRGRKAPSKGKKGPTGNNVRKAPSAGPEDTPAPESKPALHASTTSLRNDFLRAESDAPGDATSNGFSTPPPGANAAIFGVNGFPSSGAPGSQADVMEVDNLGNSVSANALAEDPDEDDAEFRTWKQVTKQDRAMAAADRNRLFRGNHLNPDEPALLRNKAGMRRWLRQQKQYMTDKSSPNAQADLDQTQAGAVTTGESLAEGIEKDQDGTLPDYYDSLTAIPGLEDHFKWAEDSEGKVVPQTEDFLRVFAEDQFVSAQSILTNRIDTNMRQMQDTRKVCAKIGIVKQMQIQAQTYQNQFQKYDPEPFLEQNIGPVVVTEDGPIMAPWTCRAAFQRSVGKIFYHAGFEDFQPSALDAVTDIASDFFMKLTRTLGSYREATKAESTPSRFTAEEQVLHCLHDNGLDLEGLETYVKEDVERLGTKLVMVHDRMKSHLADLLRPALAEGVGADGVGAFNDGSEQFVGGDFAGDIDEDFFGFKELGLAEELGLDSLSVPLHLLQNRMQSAYQANNTTSAVTSGVIIEPPPPYEPITTENLALQIGLVQSFFASKLAANNGRPLVEDEDLPPKQRFPKPRLGPTGKISSPRKRPLREQQQAAKKRRKLEEHGKDDASGLHVAKAVKPIAPLRLQMPDAEENGNVGDPDKQSGLGKNGTVNGTSAMMSPESLTAS